MDTDQALPGVDHRVHRQPLEAVEVEQPCPIDARRVEMLFDPLQPPRTDQFQRRLPQLGITDRHFRDDAVAHSIAGNDRLCPGGERRVPDHVAGEEGHPLAIPGSAVGVGPAGTQGGGAPADGCPVEMRGNGPRTRALCSPSRRNRQDGPFDHVHDVTPCGTPGNGCAEMGRARGPVPSRA